MGLIELFKEFHSQAVEGRFPASSRALYNFFLGEFNNRFWATEQLTYSYRELADLTQMSKSSVERAVHFLAVKGFLEVKSPSDKTNTRKFFKFPAGHSRDRRGTLAGHFAES